MDLTDRAFRHLTAWGLPGGPTDPISARGVDQGDLARLAERHRMTGVAIAALDDGALDGASDELTSAMLPAHRHLLHSSLAAEANLVAVSHLLAGAGIEHRVLKGCATAHLDHADPSVRLTSDADVLVPVGGLDAVASVIAPYVDDRATVPDRAPGWRSRFGKDLTVSLRSGGWIDVHQRIASGYFGERLAMDEVWADGECFELAGHQLTGLAPTMRLLHAAVHAAGRAGLHSQRDVLVLLDRADVDWRAMTATVERWGIEALAARGISTTWASFGVARHPLLDWADSIRPRGRPRLALGVFDHWAGHQSWTSGLAMAPRDWPGYAWPMIWPSDEYLAHYDRSRVRHVLRPIRKLGRPQWTDAPNPPVSRS